MDEDLGETRRISTSVSPPESPPLADPDGPDGDHPRVLWGRVVALAVALQLAFFIGRACAPGVSESQYNEVRQELSQTRAELETQTAANSRPTPTPAASPSPSPSPTAEAQTYVVERGDTLAEIAEQFYKDADMDDFLAEANQIADKTQLRVGQRLTIPPKPSGSPTPSPSPRA